MKWIIRGSSSTTKTRRRREVDVAILLPDEADKFFFLSRWQDFDEVDAVHRPDDTHHSICDIWDFFIIASARVAESDVGIGGVRKLFDFTDDSVLA
jgi:hypothetical protein